MNVRSDFGGCSATWLRISFVLQMRTLALSPPVAIREPSGCTWHENIDTRFSSPRIAESVRAFAGACRGVGKEGVGGRARCGQGEGGGPLCMTHAGFVNLIVQAYAAPLREQRAFERSGIACDGGTYCVVRAWLASVKWHAYKGVCGIAGVAGYGGRLALRERC